MKECCGVLGVFSFDEYDILPMLLTGLEALQHRGQESWGIAVGNHRPYKKMGLVSWINLEDFKEISDLKGNVGIGHVRYSTTSQSTLRNAHPIEIEGFSIAHNGTLDRQPLIRSLKKMGCSPLEKITDTELAGLLLHQNLKREKSWSNAFERLNPELNGSFSIVILTAKGELIGARDDRGFRPLCLGWHKETSSYIISSESCALDILGARLLRDIQPGEIIKINRNGLEKQRFSVKERHAHCPFEYTYFAHPSSYIEGVNVYYARKTIGKRLAERYPLSGDVVIPVPDSARPSALGYSEVSGIPFEEGLMKNRYRSKGSWRSFIEPKKREEVVKKISPIRQIVEGKRVILVDDSIVRGTSSKIIVGRKLKNAEQVSMIVSFPPIMYPCYAGIDFPTQEELLVHRVCKTAKSLDEINRRIAREIGVKILGYNDVESLSKGIGIPKDQLCLSCTTGDYDCLKYGPRFKTRNED